MFSDAEYQDRIQFYVQRGRLERSLAFHAALTAVVGQIKKIFTNTHKVPAMGKAAGQGC